MNTNELAIIVSMRDEFSQKLNGIDKQLQSSAKEAGKAQMSFKKLVGAVGGVTAVYKAWGYAMNSIAKFNELEESQARLEKIVSNATGSTKEQIQVLHEQAQALENIGVVDKQVIASAQAKLATFDMSINAIKELTPALLDYAVAEYGVSVSSEQIVNAAQGFGKALQGNTELLTKQGFVISDYEKQVLETGTETERLAMFNEILGRTYKGVNEEMTKTTEGAMKNFEMKIDDINTAIGKELSVSLKNLQDGFIDFITVGDDGSEMLKFFGNSMYRLSALINITLGSIKQVTGGIKPVIETAGIGIASMLDQVWTLATKGGKAGLEKQEIYAEILAETWDKAVTNVGNTSEQLQKEMDKLVSLEGLEELRKGFDLSKLGNNKDDNTLGLPDPDEIKKQKEELAKALDDFAGEYAKFGEKLEDQLFDLGEDHSSAVAKFKDQIKGIRDEMNSLNASFAKGEKSDRMSMAEEIVANEERIAEIQKELAGEVEKKKAEELRNELNTRLLAEQENVAFTEQFANEIAEVKRVAGLTDLERAIEEYNSRRALATQEFNEKMSTLRNQMSEVKKAQKEEKVLYEEKTTFIKEQMESAEKRHAESMATNLMTTAQTIEKEIEYYKRLAVAIDAVRGSNTSGQINRNMGKITKVNDAVIAPNGNVVSTHPDDYLIATKDPKNLGGGSITINLNGNFLSEDVAEEIGNKIVEKLQLQSQL